MLYRPTTIGGAMHKAATTFPGNNHVLARDIRSKINMNGKEFSVAMPDSVPRKQEKKPTITMAQAMEMSMEMDMAMSKKRRIA